MERTDIIRRSIRHLPTGLERALVAAADADLLAGCLIFTSSGFALLLQERTLNSWFRILREDGSVLPESSDLVVTMRREEAGLRLLRYHDSGRLSSGSGGSSEKLRTTFDRQEYLRSSYRFFDDIKYAPLAALGFRFRKASLSGIYIEASDVVASGAVKVRIGQTYALQDAAQAHRDLEARKTTGSTVLLP